MGSSSKLGYVLKSEVNKYTREVLDPGVIISYDYANGANGFTITITGNANLNAPANLPTLLPGQFIGGTMEITASGGDFAVSANIIYSEFPTDAFPDGVSVDVPFIYNGTTIKCGAPAPPI